MGSRTKRIILIIAIIQIALIVVLLILPGVVLAIPGRYRVALAERSALLGQLTEGVIEQARREFPALPLEFCFYPPRAGRLVERIDVSTFFNSMNNVTALGRCRTRWALLHDFDLYPLAPNYFRDVIEKMQREAADEQGGPERDAAK